MFKDEGINMGKRVHREKSVFKTVTNQRLGLTLLIYLLSVLGGITLTFEPAASEGCDLVIPRQSHHEGYLAITLFDDVSHNSIYNAYLHVEGRSGAESGCSRCAGFSLAPGLHELEVAQKDHFSTRIYNIPIAIDSLTDLKIYLTGCKDKDSLAKVSLEPVYNITMRGIIDPGPGDFYGRIYDRSTAAPIVNAEIKVPDTKYIARSDIDGTFWIRDVRLEDTCLDWIISHYDYETMYVHTNGTDSSWASMFMAFLEKKKSTDQGDSSAGPKVARFAYSNSSSGVFLTVIRHYCPVVCSTKVNLEEGDEFGLIDDPCPPKMHFPLKLLRIIDDSTVEIGFDNSVSVMSGKPGEAGRVGSIPVGRSETCFMENAVDGGRKICVRRIDY
jgi:hypothetical protein